MSRVSRGAQSPERWEKLAELYHQVSDCQPSRWVARLDELCEGDEELRRDVASLLGQDADQEGVVERVREEVRRQYLASPPETESEEPVRPLPEVLGRYRVIRLLGTGGMGAVYEAEQDQPRRIVALKVIRPGLVFPESLRRFEREWQTMGRLHHPGIAEIYEAGSAATEYGPQPFFAMEFIQGESLLRYAAAQHLTIRQRLELMTKVCDAVQHAHGRGIIHRDLKPANILVDETGQPKILDFGVARASEPGLLPADETSHGEMLGTPAYMSPEQVLADPRELDARSDVYQLGVILYELLAGRMPYQLSRNPHEAARIIREREPEPLSVHQPLLPRRPRNHRRPRAGQGQNPALPFRRQPRPRPPFIPCQRTDFDEGAEHG